MNRQHQDYSKNVNNIVLFCGVEKNPGVRQHVSLIL